MARSVQGPGAAVGLMARIGRTLGVGTRPAGSPWARERSDSPPADVAERNRRVVENMRLVHFWVRRFKPATLAMRDDMVQEGTLGLMRALETFDPTKGAFGPYASNWIRVYVQRANPKGRIVALTLDGPAVKGDDAPPVVETIADEREGPEGLTLTVESTDHVRRTLLRIRKSLSELEWAVVERRFLGDETLKDVASQFGISRERVRQVELRLRGRLTNIFKTSDAAATEEAA